MFQTQDALCECGITWVQLAAQNITNKKLKKAGFAKKNKKNIPIYKHSLKKKHHFHSLNAHDFLLQLISILSKFLMQALTSIVPLLFHPFNW